MSDNWSGRADRGLRLKVNDGGDWSGGHCRWKGCCWELGVEGGVLVDRASSGVVYISIPPIVESEAIQALTVKFPNKANPER